MLTFSTVLALPFFVLALVPGMMRKMPRSGDWMNSVKIVGGLVEIGAAFKFLNTAEVNYGRSPENAFFNASFVLTAWVVVAIVCGIYLLGLFRTSHDHDAVQVGPTRMLIGMSFLAVALFLMPALFGVKPQNKVYEAVAGILPPDEQDLDVRRQTVFDIRSLLAKQGASPANPGASGSVIAAGPVKATSKDPAVAVRQEKKFHGVRWGLSYDEAKEQAKAANRLILIDFTGLNCVNCRTVERTIMPRPDVVAEMEKFVTLSLYNDQVDISSLSLEDKLDLADENKVIQDDLLQTIATPIYAVVTPEGKLVGKVEYDPSDSDFLLNFLKGIQAKQGGEKVATK